MKEMNSFIYKILFLILIIFPANVDGKTLGIGNTDAKITIKVFSSLTCPHCANFHKNIYEELKKDFIDKDLVRFEHHGFPLDLAALNAEIIVRCHIDYQKQINLLGEIYKKQNNWAVGSDINVINESIKKIGLASGLENSEMDVCLKNEDTQDQILNERIEAQKKYKIQSTPTILINDKQYEGDHDYKLFKKAIEKILRKYAI